MSYAGGKPRVYLLRIETGQQELVGDFNGMTFAPRFSPSGQKIIMSLQQDVYGLIWVGTRGGGAAVWNPRSWSRNPASETGGATTPRARAITAESAT